MKEYKQTDLFEISIDEIEDVELLRKIIYRLVYSDDKEPFLTLKDKELYYEENQ